jgi:hypothetical protein
MQRGSEDAERFSSSSGQLPGKALRLAVSSAPVSAPQDTRRRTAN